MLNLKKTLSTTLVGILASATLLGNSVYATELPTSGTEVATQYNNMMMAANQTESTFVESEIPEITTHINEDGQVVYTQTVTMEAVPQSEASPFALSSRYTTASVGLFLKGGERGTGALSTFRLSTIPSNAKVTSISIAPGSGKVNNGYTGFYGCVVFDSIKIFAPKNVSTTIPWNAKGMTSTALEGCDASGTWYAQVTGRNITSPMYDMFGNDISAGNLIYGSTKLTVSYTY